MTHAMPRSLNLFMIAATLASCTGTRTIPPNSDVDSRFVISGGRIGEIILGQTVDDLYGVVGRQNTRLVDLFHEGFFLPALEIQVGPRETSALVAVIGVPDGCRYFVVTEIWIYDDRFRTRDGIGVGSTVGSVREMYLADLDSGEGEWLRVRDLGLSIQTDSDIEDASSTITRMVLTSEPSDIRRVCESRSL